MSLHFSLPEDDYVAYSLKKREHDYTDSIPLSISIVSYNLAGVHPDEVSDDDLISILFPKEVRGSSTTGGTGDAWENDMNQRHVDLLVVGFQEVVPLDLSSAGSFLSSGSSERYSLWKDRIHNLLGFDEFEFVAEKNMFGLQIMVLTNVCLYMECRCLSMLSIQDKSMMCRKKVSVWDSLVSV